MIATALSLFAVHGLADYPLQGDWLAKAKNHTLSPAGTEVIWPIALALHGSIHGLFVLVITGNEYLALAETVLHCAIDHAKCGGRISYNQDQVAHLLCKLIWLMIMAAQ